jgi:phage-related protein
MELPRRVAWLGDTRRNLQAFPQPVRRDIGAALFAAQCGETAEHVKPFKGVGSGVMEIAERYATDAYRLVYTVQLGKSIYVLHVFKKKSKSGIAMPKKDVDLIAKCYKEARERAKNE